jgi:DNA-binding MarR family transcriptional regulator
MGRPAPLKSNRITVSKPTSPDRDKLAEQAALYLSTMQKLHQGFARQLAPILEEQHGIDFRLYFIIRHIEGGAVHPGAISKAIHLPNSVITRHLDQLVEKGLLERSLDAEDSRRIKLTLTKEGQRVSREANRTICTIVGARLEHLAPARREAFLSAFAALAEDAE